MKLLNLALLIGSTSVLCLAGCSSSPEEPAAWKTTEKTAAEKITAEKTTKEGQAKASAKKGLAVSSLTLNGETIYLENATLRELVVFLQMGGYSYEGLGNKLEPGERTDVTVSYKQGGDIILHIYNAKNETIVYGDCKIESFYIAHSKKANESLYTLNGLVNVRSDDREIAQAFEKLGIEYDIGSPYPTTAAAQEDSAATFPQNETEEFTAREALSTGHDVEINISQMYDGARNIHISLPILYEP